MWRKPLATDEGMSFITFAALACEHARSSCQSSFSFTFNFSYIHNR